MERSFAREVELLKQGDGHVFHGEGILAIANADGKRNGRPLRAGALTGRKSVPGRSIRESD